MIARLSGIFYLAPSETGSSPQVAAFRVVRPPLGAIGTSPTAASRKIQHVFGKGSLVSKRLGEGELVPWTDGLGRDCGRTAGTNTPGKQRIGDARGQRGDPQGGAFDPYSWQGAVEGRYGEHRGRFREFPDLAIGPEYV